jgi:glycosyltransferase involved in cell wall biosynthesis
MSKFPLTKTPIVCLACEDWWYHPPRSRRRFMEVFARRGNPVLFVNSIGMRRPSARHPDFARRIARKLRSIARMVRRVEPRLHVFSPVALPFYDSPTARRLNSFLLRFQVGTALRALGMRNPILWIGLPTYVDLMGRFGARLNVFQVTDKHDEYQEIRGDSISRAFEQLARECEVVLVSSRKLKEMLSPLNPSTYHVSHGVDLDHFASARRPDCEVPDDLQRIPTPRLGYVGALEQFIDNDLLLQVAKKRPHWQIVLIGPYSGEIRDLESMPNIHLLGYRDRQLLPAYLSGCQVCLIPKKRDVWFRYSNPLKMKEYLAAGRQVVTMRYDEVTEVERWVWVAEDRDEFLTALDAVIERGEVKEAAGMDDWLGGGSWEEQARKSAEILAGYLSRVE